MLSKIKRKQSNPSQKPKASFRFSIRMRMLAIIAVPSLAAAAIAITAASSLQTAKDRLQQLAEESIPSSQAASNTMELAARDSIRLTLTATNNTMPAEREQTILKAKQRLTDAQMQLVKLNQDLPEAALPVAKQFEEQLVKLAGELEQAWTLLNKNSMLATDEALDLIDTNITPSFALATDTIQLIQEAVDEDRKQLNIANANIMKSRMKLVVALPAIMISAGLLISFLLSGRLIRNVKKVNLGLSNIKDTWNLTARIDIASHDEIGDLAQSSNELISRLQESLLQVNDVTGVVTQAANEIVELSQCMAEGLDQQNSQVSQVSSAVDEMSSSIQEVANRSYEATSKAQDSGELADEGNRVVQETISGMQGINQAVATSSDSVRELGKRGEQIGEIILVINDIADQTNLLALNAAIEAARAGEHGRGFAVVADEVRKLADRTTKATAEIEDSISAIQQETSRAVERMGEGAAQVEGGVKLATSAGDSLDSIRLAATDVMNMVQAIAAASTEQSSASEAVSKSITAIAAVTAEANSGASQAADSAQRLFSQADQLQKLLRQFTLQAA